MRFSVDTLSLRELEALIVAAERRLKLLASRRPPSVVRRELDALAANHGYTVGELVAVPEVVRPPARKARRKVAKVAPKYRDPANVRNVWSGRGNVPRWLSEKIKRGHSRADFLIPGLAKPTAKARKVGKRSVFKAGGG